MKINDLSSRSKSKARLWLDGFIQSRYGYIAVMVFAFGALVLIHKGELSLPKRKEKKAVFRNAKGEEVPAVYFTNAKGQKAKQARVRNPWARVDRIAIIGERNSGTRWITKELQRCFPQVKVKSELVRWKHWFQEDDNQEHLTTLVVAQYRDPYFWAEAMRHVPHHAPNHLFLNAESDWEKFMTKKWTLGSRPKRDLELKNKDEVGVCYENFNYNELESCVEGSNEDPEYKKMFDKKTGLNKFGFKIDDPHDFKADKPMYELKRDGSGEPFDNLMDMRAAKIRNFMEIKKWNWVKDLVSIRYEAMLEKGTESLIKQIENITTYKGVTQLQRNCTPSAAQKRPQRSLNPELVNWITDNIDWDAEKSIGYKKRPKQTKEDIKAFKKALEKESSEKK